jgi:ArsR family transcriptional regulator
MKQPPRLTSRGLELVAGKFKALSDPTRLAVLQSMMAAERTVTEIVEATGASQPNVSRHLAVLHRAGIVRRRKAWPHCLYSIADPSVYEVCKAMCASAARSDEPIFEQ